MMKCIVVAALLFFSLNVWSNGCIDGSQNKNQCETTEIIYTGDKASGLRGMASDLNSVSGIYEYVRNNSEFQMYVGSRSNSLNSFSGLVGNDVDLASTLIAMYRSVGLQARYVKGDIKLPAVDLANWMNIENKSLAVSVLEDFGVEVERLDNGENVIFNHVWVEVLVPFDNYRGANLDVQCANDAGSCSWVMLDPSFKLKKYNNQLRNILRDITFDYNLYYQAEVNQSTKDKGPLELFEEQALRYLRENHSGVTLEDVIDEGEIIVEKLGVLPSTLPYEVIGMVERFSSIEVYDLTADTKLTNNLEVSVDFQNLNSTCRSNLNSDFSIPVSRLSNEKLAVTTWRDDEKLKLSLILGGEVVHTFLAESNCDDPSFEKGRYFDITVSLDRYRGIPAERNRYKDAIVGGYYLIATGDHTSHSKQVVDAYNQLMEENSGFEFTVKEPGKYINDGGSGAGAPPEEGGMPYGVYVNIGFYLGYNDTLLLDSLAEKNAITGGILYLAQRLFFSEYEKRSKRYAALKNVRKFLAGHVGIISSVHDVLLLDDSPFEVTPSGLLIDVKGMRTNGVWESDKVETSSNDVFNFTTHIGSALEHEIWQEITGFDALSTVRAIQKTYENEQSLIYLSNVDSSKLNPVSVPNPTYSFEEFLIQNGYTNNLPTGYEYHEYNLFGDNVAAWDWSLLGDVDVYGMNIVRGGLDSLTPSVEIKELAYQERLHPELIGGKYHSISYIFMEQFARAIEQLDKVNVDVYQNELRTRRFGFESDSGFTSIESARVLPEENDIWSSEYEFVPGSARRYYIGNGRYWHDFEMRETVRDADAMLFYEHEISVVDPIRLEADIKMLTGNISKHTFIRSFHVTDTFKFGKQEQLEAINVFCEFNSEFARYLVHEIKDCYENYDNVVFSNLDDGFDPDVAFYKPLVIPNYDYDYDSGEEELYLGEHYINTINRIANGLFNSPVGYWSNFTLTETPLVIDDSVYDFFIEHKYDSSGKMVTASFVIGGQIFSANGGYVIGDYPLDPANDINGVSFDSGEVSLFNVDFNNEFFNDQSLVSITNNDLLLTPSTIDPVSTVTGNMYHDEIDISIPSKGLSYEFTRTYNSIISPLTREPSDGGVDAISDGWTHSYNMFLQPSDRGRYPNYGGASENYNYKTSSIIFYDERGGSHSFYIDDQSFDVWDDRHKVIELESPSGEYSKLTLNSPEKGLHTIKFVNGVQYIFDSNGNNSSDCNLLEGGGCYGHAARIHKIVSPHGEELLFNYGRLENGSFVNQELLLSVTDNSNVAGRTGLKFEYYPGESVTIGDDGDEIYERYKEAGRLKSVTDWTGRKWEYIYKEQSYKTYGFIVLDSVINPLGYSIKYKYEGAKDKQRSHRLVLNEIIYPEDRGGKNKSMKFGYYKNGRAYNYYDKNNNEETLVYDLYRRTTRVTNPNGGTTKHFYNEKGALTKLELPDGGIQLFELNDDGLRNVKYNSLGQRTRYSYQLDGRFSSDQSDSDGRITKEEDSLGNSVSFQYTSNGQIAEYIDKNGNTFIYDYYLNSNESDGAFRGKLKSIRISKFNVGGVVNHNVKLAEYKYYSDGMLKQKKESVDFKLGSGIEYKELIANYSYQFDADGSYVASIVSTGQDMLPISKLQYYDRLSRMVKQVEYRQEGPISSSLIEVTTKYTYDELDRLVEVVDPFGSISSTEYDKNGKIRKVIKRYKLLEGKNSPLKSGCYIDESFTEYHSCIIVKNEYDVTDRLVKSVNLIGAETSYKYDRIGNLVQSTNHLNNSLYFEYDKLNRRIKTTNENGYSITTKYDLAGNVVAVIDANGNATRYSYDKNGQMIDSVSPEGRVNSVKEYDPNGNIIKLSDANSEKGHDNYIYENSFDEFNRLTRSINKNNEEVKYTYDALNNITSVIDALGQETKFRYDSLGRLLEIIDPFIEIDIDKTVKSTYDELGNQLSYIDRNGEKTIYHYDLLNRLIRTEYLADGKTSHFEYDQYGDLIKTSFDGHTYEYEYDSSHNLIKKVDSRRLLEMTWKYNILGKLIEKKNYQGEVFKYIYDRTNRLVSMSIGNPFKLQAQYHYDPAGRLLGRYLSNGSSTIYKYSDDANLIYLEQVGANGSLVEAKEYEYDEIGNIIKIKTTNSTLEGGSEVVIYGYDSSYRLISVSSNNSDNNFEYTYDKAGNRLTKLHNNVLHHYIYEGGNRLKEVRLNDSLGPVIYSYRYDDNGSLVAKYDVNYEKILGIEYNQLGLASSTESKAIKNSYQYDINDYRLEKSNSKYSESYFLEGMHIESIYDESETLKEMRFRGSVVDEIVMSFENNSEYFESKTYHHNKVNTLIARTDHNGMAEYAISTGPFGDKLSNLNYGIESNFTGREYEAEAGLYYFRARYYDPEIGRFISEDPLGISGGLNLYAYVGNNPLNYNDPMGTDRLDVNLFFIGFSNGIDDVTNEQFVTWSAFPGIGVTYIKNYTLDAKFSDLNRTSAEWETLNQSVSVTTPFFNAGLDYDSGTLVREYQDDNLLKANFQVGKGLQPTLDFGVFSSVDQFFDPKKGDKSSKVGLGVSWSSFPEFGFTYSDADARAFYDNMLDIFSFESEDLSKFGEDSSATYSEFNYASDQWINARVYLK